MNEIILELDKYDVSAIVSGSFDTDGYFKANLKNSFRNGKILPEGHGRLIDENNLWFEDIDDISCVTQRNVENAPTIVEADKEERQDEKT